MATFTLSPDTLHDIVNDHEKGPKLLEDLGGVPGVVEKLGTSLSQGLAKEAVRVGSKEREERETFYGRNELPETEDVTFLDLVWESLEDFMMQILIVSAIISLVLGLTVPDQTTGVVDYAHGWLEGAAILLSVTLVTLVSSLNNYQKELKFKELTKATPPVEVSVVRNGRTVEISDRELLVGDILNVAGGDVLSVDGIVLRSTSLKVDESAATGENDDIAKSSRGDCYVRSGSNIVEGEGTILVTGVGIHSFAGRIAMQVREAKEETPLQEKLTVLAENIGLFGMVAASLMFVLLSLMDLYYTFVQRKHPFYYKKYLDNLTTAVTIVVVAVPEGLPLSVTIALAYSMKQMFKENNLVRHLAACETMGGATTICTDKTGTITQNKMTVTDGVTSFGQHFFVPVFDANGDVSTTSAGQPDAAHFADIFDKTNAQHAHLRSLLLEGIVINSKSSRKVIELQKRHQRAVVLTGSKTEQALIMFVERTGIDPMELRLETLEKVSNAIDPVPTSPYTSLQTTWPGASPRAADSPSSFSKQIHTYPFTSARKRMTTGIALSGENKVRYHIKGASELILSECEYVIDENGERVPLRHDARQALENTIFTFAKRRLRTLAIAFSEVPLPKSSNDIFVESDEKLPGLTLLAIIAIQDPVRPEVPRAIAQCRSAGVLVRMITGDNKATAISIAREVGIYGPVWQGPAAGEQGLAVEGPQFRELAKSERTLNAILPRLQVISRASPLDKQILVAALMKRGEVVAVTGDGTNDAPALKNANVGFSMNSGTEVAKNASDVVILDDKFSTIVTATKWGRNVRDNISKFLQFQMTVNVAAVVVSFIGALFDASGESPLKPVQLLWINLIMDTLAALALATEYPTEKLLDRPPQPKSAPLISMRMWTNILGQSLYQIILQLLLLHSQKALDYFGVEKDSPEHLTVVFNVFVLLQLCNEFNARILDQSSGLLDGLQNAPLFILVVLSTFVIQIIGVQYGGPLMQAVPLSLEQWKKCFYFSCVPLLLGKVLRWLPVKERPLPPPPVIVDEEEERRLAAEAAEKKKRTLKTVSRQVLLQVKVLRAMRPSEKQKKQKMD